MRPSLYLTHKVSYVNLHSPFSGSERFCSANAPSVYIWTFASFVLMYVFTLSLHVLNNIFLISISYRSKLKALGKLMATIGSRLDTERNHSYLQEVFRMLGRHGNNPKINSRLRFMIRDLDELRVRATCHTFFYILASRREVCMR